MLPCLLWIIAACGICVLIVHVEGFNLVNNLKKQPFNLNIFVSKLLATRDCHQGQPPRNKIIYVYLYCVDMLTKGIRFMNYRISFSTIYVYTHYVYLVAIGCGKLVLWFIICSWVGKQVYFSSVRPSYLCITLINIMIGCFKIVILAK